MKNLNVMQNKDNCLLERRRIISAKECEIDLKDHLGLMLKSIIEGSRKTESIIKEVSPPARTRAFQSNILNSCVVDALSKNIPGSLRQGKYNRKIFIMKGYIILVKKLDRKGYPMNIDTEHNSLINSQNKNELFRNSNDCIEYPIIFLGYEEDKFGKVQKSRLVYILDNKIQWVLSLNQDSKVNPLEIFSFEDNPNEEVLVKIKTDSKQIKTVG